MRTESTSLLFFALGAAVAAGCGNSSPPADNVTFWGDVAPIYNSKCVRCHQDGGIAPFPLDDYADAKANATLELAQTQAGTMPPYFMVHDGSCGSFHDEATLTDAEKATIAAWVNGSRAEGTPVALTVPPLPTLDGAIDIATPTFAPVAQGTPIAMNDEYRCFLLDPPNAADAFLTGYDVSPGQPSIIHHVIAFLVDPNATGQGGMTNAAIMQALDDQSPDRLGWPCFGSAGDGVKVSAVPVTWAPGQGIVNYPDGMGVPIKTTEKIVVQVHYNLVDPASAGLTDTTTIHLRFADSVNRQLAFLLPDPFLASLDQATPDSLPPGQADAKFTWTKMASDFGMSVPSVDLVAVLPHMHGRGLRQTFEMGPVGNLACTSHLEHWDFHWQEVYFYKTPYLSIVPSTQLQVTCEYDTSADTQPVYPGWGTANEMCLLGMIVALPPS